MRTPANRFLVEEDIFGLSETISKRDFSPFLTRFGCALQCGWLRTACSERNLHKKRITQEM